MDAAFHEAWSVERLAGVSAVSPAHFARSFKAAFGLPPHRYLLSRRVERAVALLRDTDRPITEIALETGWTSIGTFGRVFQDITGESPGSMRLRQRGLPVAREHVPECIARAAERPDLRTAVLEKRRAKAAGRLAPPCKEAP